MLGGADEAEENGICEDTFVIRGGKGGIGSRKENLSMLDRSL